MAKIAELTELAASTKSGIAHRSIAVLAAAQLEAAAGGFDAAEAAVLAVYGEHRGPGRLPEGLFVPLLEALLVVRHFDLGARLVCDRIDPGCPIDLEIAEHGPGIGRLIWDVLLPERMRFTFDASIIGTDIAHGQVNWFVWIFPLFATYAKNWPGVTGSVVFNQFDCGLTPGLAMCDHRPGYFLVPCNAFTRTHAYQFAKKHFAESDVSWENREPVAFWRGATTGRPSDAALGWRSLPRVRLCEIAQQHPRLFDVGISGIAQITEPAAEGALRELGLMRPYVPMTDFNKYKYQIDIDGNTNAWPGLFQKLLTGSPVLKVASPYGFRQWYYDRLRPWINFVPVASDMSDLVAKTHWLRQHDDVARAIGEQGQALALSLDYEGELKKAVPTVAAALRYAARRPETELRFGLGRQDNECLSEGWFDPLEGGVPTRGLDSRIELPRPVAPEDFVLSLDFSPYSEVLPQRPQRVTIAANGEVLRHVVVTARLTVDCSLNRQTLDAADSLTITLLHPDAVTAASERRPLDARVMGITVHTLTLTPASVHAETGRVVPPTAIAPAPYRDHLNQSELLHGPDIWLPPETEFRQLLTCHESVVFADITSGRLSHGPPSTSPRNVFLVLSDGTRYLLHVAADGSRYCIRVPHERRGVAAEPVEAASALWIQGFKLVRVGVADEAAFALSHDGLFLCAEPTGQVTLSRTRPGLWERFHAVIAAEPFARALPANPRPP